MSDLQTGTRVRLPSVGADVELRSPFGAVVGPDEWDDYYIIRLDEPARFFNADGSVEDLSEITEMVDNLEVLS